MRKYLVGILLFPILTLSAQITPVNYALASNWAAGKMKGNFDMNFDPSFTIISEDTMSQQVVNIPYDTTSNYDIFCLYPTIILGLGSNAQTQPITAAHRIAGNLAIQLNMTSFSQFGRMYAPYYRQGNTATFSPLTSPPQQAGVLDTAVTDALAAFDYYMQNYNNGKKVILVGHSQGSMVIGMMLRQMEINPLYQPYLSKIFLAVMMGPEAGPWTAQSATIGGWWQNIPICITPADTACIMTYGTHQYGMPLQTIVNLVPFNSNLVTKGYVYQNLDTNVHWIINDPLGHSSALEPINYSVYPANIMQTIFGTDYNVSTYYVMYTHMYNAAIYSPDNANYGYMVDRITGIPGDNRLDPIDSAATGDLHAYDGDIPMGDVVCLIYQKMGQTCPYDYAIGIEEQPHPDAPVIFPNPTAGSLNIVLKTSDKFHLSIQNPIGQVLYSTDIDLSMHIDISSYSCGIYYISIYNNQQHYTCKILKTQ